MSRDADGVEYPLLGGHNGRLYQHGLNRTDAGLLIERDLVTRPFETPGSPASFQMLCAYFYLSGEPCDSVMLDVWADFIEERVNQFPIKLKTGGTCGLTWGEAVGGSGDKWGGAGQQPWTVERMPLGGVYQQIQYRMFLDWDTWPAGEARCTNFESTGFNPFGDVRGERDARSNPQQGRRG